MLSSLRNIISPKMVQEINYAVYNYVKLSLFMSLYSLPWIVVNLVFRFSVNTFIFYAIGFLFVFPNLMAIQKFIGNKQVTLRAYTRLLKKHYWHSFKLGVICTFLISFFIADSYILLYQMKRLFLFPLLYITLMFLVVAVIYFLALNQKIDESWKITVKKAGFISWRYTFTTGFLFLLIMLWTSLGYYVPIINSLFGNMFFWGLVFKQVDKKITTLWKPKNKEKGDLYE